MPKHREVDNGQDIIDSRDVVARIEELTDLRDEKSEDFGEDETEELKQLEALIEEAGGEGVFIRDSYFPEYAQQFAEDIGAIDQNANWPLCHIDWDAAADSLKVDYTSVDFGGEEYWIRPD